MTATPMVSTYSMWSLFRNCRKAVDWRYLQQLVPLQRDRNLHFGSIIHECLQSWHQHRDQAAVLALIGRLCPNRLQDENQRRDWHLATAMMSAYATRYAADNLEVVALEKNFEGPIVNPATGAASRSFVLAGKVDGIVRIGGEHFILEHKTAAQVDGDYLEKLWTDFQITIYAHYIEQTMGIPITGILYNVLVKAKLQQGKGETEEEFQERRAELLAKSKTGKTTAKRKQPESDEDFQQRLAEKYSDPEMFHREMLYLSRDRFDILRSELWELTQALSRRSPARGLLPEHRLLLQLPEAMSVFRAVPLQRQSQRDRQLLPARGAQRRVAGAAQRRAGASFLKRRIMLPTAKTQPKPNLADLTVLVYGQTKIGKSTFCSNSDGALFLATEPGLNSLDVYQVVIQSWDDLLNACAEITEGKHPFKTVIIDTIDNAYKFCTDYIVKKYKIEHESDLGYGKGYALVNNEFQRVLTKLAFLPYGLFVVSHAKEIEVDTRTGKYTRVVPTLPDKARKIVLGMVDQVLFCDLELDTAEDGAKSVRRVIRTKPSLYYEAGDRTGRLPETIDLDFRKFLEAFNSVAVPPKAQQSAKAPAAK